MPMMCAVAFQPKGRLYYADPGTLSPAVGDHVLYPADGRHEVAQVVWAPEWVSEDVPGLPALVAMAAPADIEAAAAARKSCTEARRTSKRLIRQHDLPMKVVGAEQDDDRITIFFTAPHRVDFRALVREIAAALHSRILLRQLSPREEARLVGGVGSCGRELCCSTFLLDFEPVTVRMAKDQDLPANPMRISGACGKLMCCLKYEHPLYQQAAGEGKHGSCGRASVCGSRQVYDTR